MYIESIRKVFFSKKINNLPDMFKQSILNGYSLVCWNGQIYAYDGELWVKTVLTIDDFKIPINQII